MTNKTAFGFRAIATDGAARAGVLQTARGEIDTPVFMPVGTFGALRGILPVEARQLGFDIILGNTFHLWLQPGADIVRRFGGLHGFGGWRGAILTDSGGYQIFSLRERCVIKEEGALFRSPRDGSKHLLTPEVSMQVQRDLNSDIVMVLDQCIDARADEQTARAAMELSCRWALRCRHAHDGHDGNDNALFGIVQGGAHKHLREHSARQLCAMGFDGYAIGGLAVGESKEVMRAVVADTAACLPPDAPRYLMGVGTPADIADAVERGVDMFDCVLPTRNGRNGQMFCSDGVLKLRNAAHRGSEQPPDAGCDCPVCRRFSRAYLHHLFAVGDALGGRLAAMHNLAFYRRLMTKLRTAIVGGRLAEEARAVREVYARHETKSA
ncbi:MAG: tRNA guanosine(34) transglycosylase Tgt [Gammaproteobacteria bacterium]